MRLADVNRVIIHEEPRSQALDAGEIARHVAVMLPGVAVEARGPLLENGIDSLTGLDHDRRLQELAEAMAAARVRDPVFPDQTTGKRGLPGEIDYERRRLENRTSAVFGILYDGYDVARLCGELIDPGERELGRVHVIFTNQLIGTWDPADKRYHARTVLCGSPAIVSTTGLVEAPAKERGYYLARRSSEMLGLSEEEKMDLARSFAGDNLAHDDPRLTEVAKGYVMQAVAYMLTGWPFCDDPGCRLFNAHWQKEMLTAQLRGGYEYCKAHREAFAR